MLKIRQHSILKKGTFYYRKMSFELRNVGATYQRLVDLVFEKQIGRNVEVYVDHMVIKSKEDQNFLEDVKETLGRLCETNMKLNSKKYVFGTPKGKLLGHIVTKSKI